MGIHGWGQSSAIAAAASSLQRVFLDQDVVNDEAVADTLKDVTGASFAVQAGKRYHFTFVMHYTVASQLTGMRFTFTGPASPTAFAFCNAQGSGLGMGGGGGFGGYDVPTVSNSSTSGAVGVANIKGYIVPSVDGDLQLRFASEVSASAVTVKAGSYFEYEEVA